MYFFEPKYELQKVKFFLSEQDLSDEEYTDLYDHAKEIIFTRLVDHYLSQLKNDSDKIYLLSLVNKDSHSDEVFNFISIKFKHTAFGAKFIEIEEEILSILLSD